MSMETRPYLLQALSPLHAGTGQSVGVIDLPIARMRATDIPFVPGSSLKGVLRELHRAHHGLSLEEGPRAEEDKRKERLEHEALFGPWRGKEGPLGDPLEGMEHAGALVVGDARLLALPVRSFFGTFALVSSPLLLRLARRDMEPLGPLPDIPELKQPGACVGLVRECVNVYQGNSRLYLEDLDLEVSASEAAGQWARLLAQALPEAERRLLAERFVVVDDNTMSFLWETATQIDTRVRIDHETGTVAQGALWTEESLPAETLLVGVLAASPSLRKGQEPLPARQLLRAALARAGALQLGGKATVGRGRCRLLRWAEAEGGRR